jgi:RNA polymerase sigma factor (sigma-70 family)
MYHVDADNELGLIAATICKYYMQYVDKEEFVYIGYQTYLKAKALHNPEKGKFSTYVTNAIRHEIARHLHNERKRIDHGSAIDVDLIPADNIARLIDKITVNELMGRLDAVQALIIRLYFFGGYEKKEIAKMLGVSTIRVVQLYQNAIHIMRAPRTQLKKPLSTTWMHRISKIKDLN